MIGGGSAGLHRQLHAGPGAKLVGVHPGLQAGRGPGGEHGGRLVPAERAPLAEHVHPARLRRARVQHGAADQVHVAVRISVELRRDNMRAQVGHLRGDLGRQRHAACLVADGEAVAGLALEGGRALAEQLGRQPPQVRPELIVGGSPGRGDGRADAACLIGPARHPGSELRPALAGEHQVRMRVDEPRQHRPAGRVNDLVGRGRLRGGPGPGHQPGFDHERSAGHRSEGAWT